MALTTASGSPRSWSCSRSPASCAARPPRC